MIYRLTYQSIFWSPRVAVSITPSPILWCSACLLWLLLLVLWWPKARGNIKKKGVEISSESAKRGEGEREKRNGDPVWRRNYLRRQVDKGFSSLLARFLQSNCADRLNRFAPKAKGDRRKWPNKTTTATTIDWPFILPTCLLAYGMDRWLFASSLEIGKLDCLITADRC